MGGVYIVIRGYINSNTLILSCKYILYIKVVYTNYFINSLNIYIGKILVFNFSTWTFGALATPSLKRPKPTKRTLKNT
jgi:hypothetical protein